MESLGEPFAGVILAGGGAARLGGIDQASVEVGGRTLLELALDALMDAAEVVVVGDAVPTERPVTFVREDPRQGGPAAGLLTGISVLLKRPRTVAVLAVDMPRVTPRTIRRLRRAARGHDGALLVDAGGLRQLAGVLDLEMLSAITPDREHWPGLPVHKLFAPLDLAEVPAGGDEARSVASWADVRELADG